MLKKLMVALATLVVAFNVQAKCTEQGVEQANQRWAQALASNDPDKVSKLYAKDAVLLATYGAKPLTTSQERHNYFEFLFSQLKNLKVHYDEIHVQMLKGGAVSSGLYTFSGIENGEKERIPARFTFIYQSTPMGCALISHHSSALPMPRTKAKKSKLKNPNL